MPLLSESVPDFARKDELKRRHALWLARLQASAL